MSNARTTRRGIAELALATGLASIACAILHLVTDLGWIVFSGTLLFGVLGVIFGIIALSKQQPKSLAVTGLVAGVVGLVFGLGLLIFTMIFVGAITL